MSGLPNIAATNGELKKHLRAEARRWLAAQPDADKLMLSSDYRIYRKRPTGLAKVLMRLVLKIAVERSVRQQTNRALLEWVKGELPGYKPSTGLLDLPLAANQIEKINKQLLEMGRSPLPDGIGHSPSKIKRALVALDRGEDISARTYKPTIIITDSAVIVDRHAHSRLENGKRIKVGKAKLSVETLEALISR